MAGNLKIPPDHISTGVFLLRFLQPLRIEVEKFLTLITVHKQTENVEPYSAHCTAQCSGAFAIFHKEKNASLAEHGAKEAPLFKMSLRQLNDLLGLYIPM